VPRIYLDNAATSFPKPESVYAAMDHFNRSLGAAAGRGGSRTSVEVDSVLRTCRKRAADLLGAESPERVAWAFNATDALNIALHGLIPG
jgi:selenocysteine lyase/cysteine desulfurase